MGKNVGRTDSIIRIILAVVILYFIDGLSGNIQILLAIVAAALVFTALNGYCILYRIFGFTTRKKKEA